MRIQTSNIAMQSNRKFISRQFSATSNTGFLGSLSNVSLSVGDSMQRQSGQRQLKSQSSLMDHFQSARNIQGVSAAEQYKSFSQIRFESLQYIMQRLFRLPLYHSMGNSFGMNGSSSLSTQVTESLSYYGEAEQTAFSTTGTVVTQDGRELNFDLSVTMSREFEQSEYASYIQQADFVDPLVINLDSNVTSVSDQKFMFDIDADGVLDSISMPTNGSGFLALDKNGDGVINDGSELFGTSSGNGFRDLAAYDEDGNGWIDENDSVWQKLLIWSKDQNGNDKLCGLGEAGVGAIYLGNVSTDFSLNNNATNETNAAIRKTGIFLYENGGAGTIQHVDFAKSSTQLQS